MNNLKDKLFWEKYRPTSLKNMILLPRIHNYIKDGIQSNMIFYGSSGLGKTTLALILAEEHDYIKISKDIGIEVLRNNIEKFVNTLVIGSKGGHKIIFIDEFDRASTALQDALKGYIEAYSERARFIFTTNHISKITSELKSRFKIINFDPINSQEREFIYNKQIAYLRAIARKENLALYTEKEPFVKMVNKHFPDLRSSIETLHEVIITNNYDFLEKSFGSSDKLAFYKYIMDGNVEAIYNYDYVMNNFFTTFDDAFLYLGRPFFEYLKEYHVDIVINKGCSILEVQKDYGRNLDNVPDPLIELVNFIIDIKEIIK
jgi:replication-associated recombination protein RarA